MYKKSVKGKYRKVGKSEKSQPSENCDNQVSGTIQTQSAKGESSNMQKHVGLENYVS